MNIQILTDRYPQLTVCAADIVKAYEKMLAVYENGGKMLFCGNGGSAADSEHIVGELMKGFLLRRPPLQADSDATILFVADSLCIPVTGFLSLNAKKVEHKHRNDKKRVGIRLG